MKALRAALSVIVCLIALSGAALAQNPGPGPGVYTPPAAATSVSPGALANFTGQVGGSNFASSQFPYTDNFTRANTSPGTISNAPTGQSYSVTGADAALTQISGNSVKDLQTVSSSDSYFSPGLITGNVVQIGAQVTFYAQAGGTSSTPSFTLIASEDATISLSHMVHTIVDTTAHTTTWNGASQNQNPTGGCQTVYNPANGGAAQNGGNALTAFVAGETLTAIKSITGNTMHLYVYTSTGESYTQDCSSLSSDNLISTLWGAGTATAPIVEFSMGSSLAPAFTQMWVETSNGTVTVTNPMGQSIIGNSNLSVIGGIDNTVIGANTPSAGFFSKVGIGTQGIGIPSGTALNVHLPGPTTTSANVIIDNSGDTANTRPELQFQTTNSNVFLGGLGFRGATSGAQGAEEYVDNLKQFHFFTNAVDRVQIGQPGGSNAGAVLRKTPVTIATGSGGLAVCSSTTVGSFDMVDNEDGACLNGQIPVHTSCTVGTTCYECPVACEGLASGPSWIITATTPITALISGGGSLSTGSNSTDGEVTSAAATGNVLTPGFICPNAVTLQLTDETTLGGAALTAANATTATFKATASDTVQYHMGCR